MAGSRAISDGIVHSRTVEMIGHFIFADYIQILFCRKNTTAVEASRRTRIWIGHFPNTTLDH